MARQTAGPRVAFNDVRVLNERMRPEIDEAIRAVIDDGRFELGREVYEFEVAFAAFCGAPHAVAVHSGTAALHVALRAMGIGAGDEVVIFQPYYENYGPDAQLSGAKPVWVDLHPPDWSIDPDELRRAFSKNTRAIIVNTPNNPTGKVFNRTELELIAGLCQEYDCYAITD